MLMGVVLIPALDGWAAPAGEATLSPYFFIENAKQQGQSASLLEQQRPNVFSMNIANIMPDDTIEVELHYTELLVPTEGVYEFVYPTVVGPRYSTQLAAEAPGTDKWIKNPYVEQGSEPQTKFSIHATVSTGIALQELVCPSHEIETLWEGDAVARVALAETAGDSRPFCRPACHCVRQMARPARGYC